MQAIIAPAFRRKPCVTLTLAVLAILAASPVQAADPMVERGETRKICQVTGEIDRSTGQRTINATESRFGFWGTDLGASFEHDGKQVFLFGDTHPVKGLDRDRDRDIIAISDDRDPEDCLEFDVVTDADGGYRPLTIAGVDGGPFSVPTGGFSAGGAMYVIATTGKSDGSPMARSVLASSTNGGRDFRPEYVLSSDHFINVAAARADQGIVLFGSGRYRTSDTYLAMLPEDSAHDRSTLRYFAGLDANGAPIWSAREQDSGKLFEQSCVGELSAAWNAELRKWVMVYNCGAPQSRILLRTADRPWGPWSEPQVLFDAAEDRGFCTFMNAAGSGDDCPLVSDAHNPGTIGDPYAPYLIAGFSKGVAGSHSDIYFLMSTWNPYNVVLMKARLRLPDGDPTRRAEHITPPTRS